MFRELLPFEGDWQEAIKPISVEQIKNPEFFDGLVRVRFDYETNKKGYFEPIAGLNKTQETKNIKIYDDLPIKNGDRFIIDGKVYSIENVEWVVEEVYKGIVKRYPTAWKQYSYKRIELV